MVNANDSVEPSKRISLKDEERLLGEFTELVRLNSKSDIHSILKEFIQKAKNFTEVDTLCIYHARTDNLCYTKLASIEKEKQFPKVINLDEVNFSGESTIWRQGEPVNTRLQIYAQEMGLKYLITTKLMQGEGQLGLISAGMLHANNSEVVTRRLEVVGGLLSSILQKYIYEIYLKNQNDLLSGKNKTLDLVFQHTKDAIVVVDKNLRVLEINQTAEQILGYSIKEIEKRPVTDVLIGADGLIDALGVALEGIEIHELGIVSLHRRDGQAFSAHIRVLPITNDREKLQGILILISDESENEQNRIKVQHLEQRAALGSLASIFSHEVKNPINNIYLAIQLMQSWTEEGDRNYEVVDRLYKDCSRLKELTESILSFSRPVEPKLKIINIVFQISGILDRWRPRFERLHIESNPLLPDAPLYIEGDVRMIDQIFTNLINNSVDAMEKTGGTLSIKIVKNTDDPQKPQAEIAVSDTGPGMSEEWLEKIFQPFKTTKTKGTGLGLAITKQMVTALHGTIQAESFNIGCVFTVRFPLHTESIH